MTRVAIVTGGTRGIGAAISKALAAKGYKVAANYVGCEETALAFTEETGIPHFKFDVSDFDAAAAGVKNIVAELGAVDVLVNNAGITRDAFLHKMTPQQWRAVISTNLDSLFNMTHAVLEGMRQRNYGRIINISSINGQTGQVGQTNYSAAKAGVIGFTKALAQEVATKGITVNAVAPGYIDTDMVRAVAPEVLEKIVAKIPMKRLGKAEEIAAMVTWLASDEAAFAQGATFTVNGAQYIT